MRQPLESPTGAVRFAPGRLAVVLAVTGMTVAWLVALGGLVGLLGWLDHLGWPAPTPLVLLCGAAAPAVWATLKVVTFTRVRSQVPDPVLRQRWYGDLASVAADEDRSLRSVGVALTDVVARTDALLGRLIAIPSVRIFQGVRPRGATRPVAPHAVCAGRMLILVESVAWPPGRYRMDATGRVRCDGQYIGQSTRSLKTAIKDCRLLLPRNHQVSAFVVVHRTAHGSYTLPPETKELGWALADELPRELQARLARHPSTVSRHTIAALGPVAAGGAA
ncbi:MAG TPA: hypothetical protein VFC00_36745 [Micromonosporaceae bacterium]|nr:hypothetical protein [Micromonosporaceae bacterium]